MCDWLAFGALYARNGRTISGRQILTEDWVSMTTSPSHFAPHGESSFFDRASLFFLIDIQGSTACTGKWCATCVSWDAFDLWFTGGILHRTPPKKISHSGAKVWHGWKIPYYSQLFRHSPILSKQTGLIVASGYHGQSVSVFPQLDIVIARFGLTSVEVDWDLTSLLETVISLFSP